MLIIKRVIPRDAQRAALPWELVQDLTLTNRHPNIWGTVLACNENSEQSEGKESEDGPRLWGARSESQLQSMEYFDAKQIQMGTAKHLALQKF